MQSTRVASARTLARMNSPSGSPSTTVRREGPYRRRFTTPRVATQAEGSEAESAPIEPVEGKFNPAELKTYQIPEGRLFQVLALTTGFIARGGSGCFVSGYSFSFAQDRKEGQYRPFTSLGFPNVIESNSKISTFKRPEKPLEIYEYQACPFCLKVREAVCILDLDVLYYPTPRGAPHHRPRAQELGGKLSFPFMVDPNTGKSMYESDDIIAYLFKEYGDGNVPLALKLGPLTAITCTLYTLLRIGRGFNYRKARYPEEPLKLWGYEGSPFTKFAREALVELELPFLQTSCSRGSQKRQELMDRVGAFQVPYLEDPNTGVAMFESDEILKYLEETYAVK